MTAPAGSISLAQEYLRTSLADVTAFRTWCGAADQAAALARIHHEGLPAPRDKHAHTIEELRDYRPYAIVFTAEQNGFRLDVVDGDLDYTAAGGLILRLFQDAAEVFDDEPSAEANLTFRNAVGEIIDGLGDLAGQAGYLAFNSLVLEDPLSWTAKKYVPGYGVVQRAQLRLDWQGI